MVEITLAQQGAQLQSTDKSLSGYPMMMATAK